MVSQKSFPAEFVYVCMHACVCTYMHVYVSVSTYVCISSTVVQIFQAIIQGHRSQESPVTCVFSKGSFLFRMLVADYRAITSVGQVALT